MKQLTCPLNGSRPLQEFHFGGEVRDMPNPAKCDDDAWASHLFHRHGEPAIKREWWYHIPSGYWFIAERDNMTDQILRTYAPGEDASA